MTTRERATRVMQAVHEEAKVAPWPRWIIGLAALGWAAYRIESHSAHVEASAKVEHIITASIAAFGIAYLPYARESVVALLRGVGPFVPGLRKNGNGSTGGTAS